MCGILGGNDFSLDYKIGIQKIKHRGPDGLNVIEYKDIVMAFARLAIIDLSKEAMQPMDSIDNNVHIIFNGEIYGYQKIKDSIKCYYEFKTNSDTEVILALYYLYGDNFIDKIDGMFAIAIYDERQHKLKLYRDRAGIKPLYYYNDGSRFLFSSELKAIQSILDKENLEIDNSALYDYLSYGYIPEPKSLYKKVHKLKPAMTLVYNLQSKEIESINRYWRLNINTNIGRRRSKEKLCEEFRDLVSQSIKEQMIADVPVGCFLSGGIDSSIVTYECMKFNRNIEAFSIGFEEKNYSELKYVEILTEQLGINSNTEVLNKDSVKGLYYKIKEWYDEPFSDTSAFPTYLVSKKAAGNVTVVLTGDGGDELFGGYSRYKKFIDYSKNEKTHRFIKLGKFLVSYGIIDEDLWSQEFKSSLEYYSELMGCKPDFMRLQRKKIFGLPNDYDEYWLIRKYYKNELPVLTRSRYLDFKTYLPGDILTKVDRTSMAVSLEARIPFLSRKLIEFAFSLSQEECNGNEGLKQIMKDAYDSLLPHEILYRGKKGFSIPPRYIIGNISGFDGTRRKILEAWGVL